MYKITDETKSKKGYLRIENVSIVENQHIGKLGMGKPAYLELFGRASKITVLDSNGEFDYDIIRYSFTQIEYKALRKPDSNGEWFYLFCYLDIMIWVKNMETMQILIDYFNNQKNKEFMSQFVEEYIMYDLSQRFKMNSQLKESIDNTFSLCDVVEDLLLPNGNKGVSIKDKLRENLLHFIVSLTRFNRQIDDAQADFIINYLDYPITPSMCMKNANDFGLYDYDFINKVPEIFQIFVLFDNILMKKAKANNEEVTFTSKLLLTLLCNIGKEFLQCNLDDVINLVKYDSISFLKQYLKMIDDYITENLNGNINFSSISSKTIIPSKTNSNDTISSSKRINMPVNPYDRLNNLIGLHAIKNDVNNIVNLVKMQLKRQEQGLKSVPVSLHLVFAGNPGTGKTTP